MNPPVRRDPAHLAGERRPLLQRLQARIFVLYPDPEKDLSEGRPAGRSGGVPAETGSEHHIAEFRRKHPKIRNGKGCINFKVSALLPISELERVTRPAIDPPNEV